MLNSNAKGVYTIAVTPFEPDGRIDFRSLDSVTDFYVESGVAGITVLGILGEAQKLEPEESISIVRQVVRQSNNLPVVVGVPTSGFAAMRSLARSSMDAGAAGVMIAPPPHMRSDEQILNYYAQAVKAVGEDIPFAIQDHPLLLNVVITANLMKKIVNDHASCVMIKHEDWPGLEKITRLRKFEADATMRKVSILCGNGGLFLDFETGRGADGAMTGYAFPDVLVELITYAQRGDREAAHDLFDAHLPLLRYEQQQGVGLAVRKFLLKSRGVIASDALREPRIQLTKTAEEEVNYLLSRLAKHDCMRGKMQVAAKEP